MTEQDRYIPGVPCWIDTAQRDPQAAADFYAGLFGWEIEDVTPAGAPSRYLIGRLGGKDAGGIAEASPDLPQAAWNTYVWVDSADETAQRVRDAGGSVLLEPMDVSDAGRMAGFTDPEGAAFFVWEARRHRGAGVVNEHGSLNFNTLSTRDPEAAAAFYGAVFGWEALGIDGGQPLWWVLPAYGDFLEQRTPGLRQNMKDMGAPERFEEVVAAINVIPADQSGMRAHWGITFGVDDADLAASKAFELGGRVDVPPFDAPWTRMAVITDPQGATFIASKFVPENKDLPEPAGMPAVA